MNAIFFTLFVCAILVYFQTGSKPCVLYKGKHDVTSFNREFEKIKNVPIDRVGVYSVDPTANGTWASTFIRTSAYEIFSHDSAHTKLQYKTDCLKKNPIDALVRRMFPVGHHTSLRVCSPNWEFKVHFDCSHNRTICLRGSKRFLMFEMYGHPSENQILDAIMHKTNEETKHILDTYGIRHYEYLLEEGDELYMKPKMYHRVESDESSIILGNVEKIDDLENCTKKFDSIWPRQSKICKNNKCLD